MFTDKYLFRYLRRKHESHLYFQYQWLGQGSSESTSTCELQPLPATKCPLLLFFSDFRWAPDFWFMPASERGAFVCMRLRGAFSFANIMGSYWKTRGLNRPLLQLIVSKLRFHVYVGNQLQQQCPQNIIMMQMQIIKGRNAHELTAEMFLRNKVLTIASLKPVKLHSFSLTSLFL